MNSIIVPFDEPVKTQEAIDIATEMAKTESKNIQLVHTIETPASEFFDNEGKRTNIAFPNIYEIAVIKRVRKVNKMMDIYLSNPYYGSLLSSKAFNFRREVNTIYDLFSPTEKGTMVAHISLMRKYNFQDLEPHQVTDNGVMIFKA